MYVGSKQWTKVKDAIKQPDDGLSIEGTPMLDSNVTTKLLQRAQKAGRAKDDVGS